MHKLILLFTEKYFPYYDLDAILYCKHNNIGCGLIARTCLTMPFHADALRAQHEQASLG